MTTVCPVGKRNRLQDIFVADFPRFRILRNSRLTLPLWRDSAGYIELIDHSVLPDVSWRVEKYVNETAWHVRFPVLNRSLSSFIRVHLFTLYREGCTPWIFFSFPHLRDPVTLTSFTGRRGEPGKSKRAVEAVKTVLKRQLFIIHRHTLEIFFQGRTLDHPVKGGCVTTGSGHPGWGWALRK